MVQHFSIVGAGTYLPRVRLTAEDVDRRAGLPEGWTRTRVGVHTRYECTAPETLATMAEAAVTKALASARLDWESIDLILDASTSRLQPIPCNASLVQQRFGEAAAGIPCLDVQSTCLSFVTALHVANSLLSGTLYRHILIVSSEAGLAGVNWHEPESACLIGDGAAAVIVRQTPGRPTYAFAHQTFAAYADLCEVRGGGHGLPPYAYHPSDDAAYRFHMDGPGVFRVARRLLPPLVSDVLRQAGTPPDALHVVPHQASPRSLALMRRLLGFSEDRYHQCIAAHGNLIAAGIPFTLARCLDEGRMEPGDPVLLLGTSAGYSQAALFFRL